MRRRKKYLLMTRKSIVFMFFFFLQLRWRLMLLFLSFVIEIHVGFKVKI